MQYKMNADQKQKYIKR